MSTIKLNLCSFLIKKSNNLLCHSKWRLMNTRNYTNDKLREIYDNTKAICLSKKPPHDVDPKGVFACNELHLNEISVYGFDYDFTLACYKGKMDYLLYNLGREVLINKYMYPKEIRSLEYKPDFAIRGLHYDIEKGLLMKLDSFLQIQLGTVYRGMTPVADHAVLDIYKNRVIPRAYVEGTGKFGESSKLHQLADLFSMPEMGLLSNIAQHFSDHQIDYDPEILFRDVQNAIGSIHPVMHREVMSDPQKYLDESPQIRQFFLRLIEAKKKVFLITNSPFAFVDAGLKVIVGADWMDFFDIIIVQARKPKFFTDESRPLRVFDPTTNTQLWDRVLKMEKGVIYCEGTIKNLQQMTGWSGDEVLYFGDHPYSDLADATLEHGWRTGAIIHELTHEIVALNNDVFKIDNNWCHMLTHIIEYCQDHVEDEDGALILNEWLKERQHLLNKTKTVFNPQFGSVFRTFTNPSYFSRRLFRFADIYTSNITNLLSYSTKHSFFPRRGALPHEYASLFM